MAPQNGYRYLLKISLASSYLLATSSADIVRHLNGLYYNLFFQAASTTSGYAACLLLVVVGLTHL